MTIEFHRVQCGKLLRTSAEKAGLEAKCPGCGTSVTVPHAETDRQDLDDFDEFYDDEFGSDYDEFESPPSSGRMKNCPMCGEQIQAAAVKCRYCGENLMRGVSPTSAVERSVGFSIASMVLGIIGLMTYCLWFLSLPISILAVIFGGIALKQIKSGLAAGKGMAIAGLVCGLIPLALWMLFFAFFFLLGIGGALMGP